ncbi:putative glyoxalase superfamily protein PhnB [Ornithinicoccus hortensis]|uniref:Putative glyoxalase superfamily protein PhnB n=1 Tax=Ornithinicoccus hortensis TaxID=82346 RepID=A0A542YNI6_9MICO|nr:putative glyoxalase superfamily protein PhnB [Ornithinicoccus hortensis]
MFRMALTQSVISINVSDVRASSEWAQRHLGFTEAMAAEGFASLTHPEAGFHIALLAVGLETFKPASAAGQVDGLLIAFEVDDMEQRYARLQDEGVTVVTPLEVEPWGERYFQVADPSGVIYQFVDWVEAPPADAISQQV